MKASALTGQFTLRCLDQRHEGVLAIDKKKILLGSHEHCDFRLNDKSVSSYHAFILLKNEGGFMVKDLYSEGGVYVNGRRVEESFVGPGDVLTLGTLSFAVEMEEEVVVPVFDLDSTVTVAAPAENLSVELPPREGLVFIDGEYCDIKFDESAYRPLESIPQVNFKGEFIELEHTEQPLEISHPVKGQRLEVISYMNGLIMDVKYIKLRNGEYHLDPVKKSDYSIPFHTLGRTQIFSVKKGELRFYAAQGVTPSCAWESINLKEAFFITHGSEQVSFRFVEQTIGWKGLPFLYRERASFLQSAKVFATVFLPIMLLLFINVDRPEEVKQEVAVVYKLPTPEKPVEALEKSELSAQEVTSKTENTGHKENDQPKEKVDFAAASQKQKVVAKATAPAAAAAKPVKTTPVKSYSFNSNVAMNSLVGDAPNINTEGTNAKSAVKDATFNTGSADDGRLVASANIGVSKFNGADKSGSGSGSYGSKGLAAKAGFDSSYLEPKTVVLGSMDPELLRKILREYIPQFRSCYQDELIAHSEKIKGIIDLNFTINASGKVSKFNIKVKDAQFSKKGIGCMGRVLGLIDFPRPKGGGVVDVKQPLNFLAETEKI